MRSLFRPLFFLLLLLNGSRLAAQPDSVAYSSGFKFNEGLYLTFTDFRENKPIPKASIVSDFDHNEIDFIRKLTNAKTITYKDHSGVLVEISPERLWGISENNSVYIHFNGDFNKIVVMGSLCHFTAMYTTYLSSGPTTMSGPVTGAPVESMQQYVLDMQTGSVYDFILPNMEDLLERDAVLYKEFMALRKGKRRQMMFIYLRKYNEKHPLYFPA